MPFNPVPLDYEALVNQAPVWNGGTVDNDTTFNSDVTVNGFFAANKGAEINEGLTVNGGITVDFFTRLNVGDAIYFPDDKTLNAIRFRYVADEGVYMEQLTTLPATWTERGHVGIVTI